MKYSLILLILIISSCAGKSYNLNIEEINISDTVAEVKKNSTKNTSIKALARVKITSASNKIFFDQITVARKYGFIRLEALAIFNNVVAQIISDSEKVYFITKKEKLVFDDPEDFSFSFLYPNLPPDLRVKNLVNVLLASSPVEIWNSEYKVELLGTENYLKIIFNRDDLYTIWVNINTKFIEKIKYKLSNGEVAEIFFSEYVSLNGDYFPKNILIKSRDYSLNIIYSDDLKINEKIDISLFQPSV